MSSAFRFPQKSMVVTGAAQGIGKQVAIDAASEGARVMLVDRSPLVEAVAAEITASFPVIRRASSATCSTTRRSRGRARTR